MSKENTMTETEKLVESASYMIENPSAWDTFDQRGSDMIAALVKALTAWNTRPAPALDREGVARALRETVMPKSVRITQYAGHVYDFGSLPGITDEIVDLLADATLAMVGGGVPEGYKLVPVEPTEAMIKAYFGRCRELGFTANASAAWEAMLSASTVEG
jgi:hypothetical protein